MTSIIKRLASIVDFMIFDLKFSFFFHQFNRPDDGFDP